MRIAVLGLIGFALSFGVVVQSAGAAAQPDSVVSYFSRSADGSRDEWRIWDSRTRRDALFLSTTAEAGFEGVRWDKTFDHAWFSRGDSIFVVPWRIGARPHAAASLPSGSPIWWFNADLRRWQCVRYLLLDSRRGPVDSRVAAELLDSDSTGSSWRMVRRDTISRDEYDSEFDVSDWPEARGGVRTNHTRSPEDLRGEPAAVEGGDVFDTAQVVLIHDRALSDEARARLSWFVSFLTTPVRGISYSSFEAGAPEEDFLTGPICYVDLEHRVRRCLTEAPARGFLFSQYRNFILLPTIPAPVILDDTGRMLLQMSEYASDAVWVPRPRR